ncbi:MAG: crossover junction endodeoxyribonuclease RuvC [Deltaproteobacteria bacterium]|nr:crossover junction endodeoxyribonuclease RuvC [Deltaproteobacteria bacterium]MBU51334.1 crossover junction endodeoxyribonuclease RuvC [Deltaproteobacteria bacterium]
MREEKESSVERILGIDPGSLITGWGIIDYDNNRISHVDNGGIFTRQKAFHQRLREIHEGLKEVLEEYKPTIVSMEQVFVSKNAQSALKLGQARGVALITVLNKDLTVHEYAPTKIKQIVTGKGRADKEQVARMVQTLLGLPEPAQVDASDALAAAITYALQPDVSEQTNELLALASKSKRKRSSRRKSRAKDAAALVAKCSS